MITRVQFREHVILPGNRDKKGAAIHAEGEHEQEKLPLYAMTQTELGVEIACAKSKRVWPFPLTQGDQVLVPWANIASVTSVPDAPKPGPTKAAPKPTTAGGAAA